MEKKNKKTNCSGEGTRRGGRWGGKYENNEYDGAVVRRGMKKRTTVRSVFRLPRKQRKSLTQLLNSILPPIGR